jgi:cytidine deaminase
MKQDIKALSPKHASILEKAKNHAKKTYKEGITSMASVLSTADGKYYTGVNVKYKKVWRCICSEKTAIAKAIEDGQDSLAIIVTVKYFPEEDDFAVINMCGECRQIAVFYPALEAIVDDGGVVKAVPIQKVVPYPYF